jgi:hypothetical protein
MGVVMDVADDFERSIKFLVVSFFFQVFAISIENVSSITKFDHTDEIDIPSCLAIEDMPFYDVPLISIYTFLVMFADVSPHGFGIDAPPVFAVEVFFAELHDVTNNNVFADQIPIHPFAGVFPLSAIHGSGSFLPGIWGL